MDQGSMRTFTERAEIRGHAPGAFCQHNYAYLRSVLASPEADPMAERPVCF
jgi:hypothetical protein